MSFLNPIRENVLVFSSTDNAAPQINYAKRVAGDVKTVLKACLVTGYGDKQSAGWTMTAESDNTAEFASPALSMIDNKLVIDDNYNNKTDWRYKYKNTLITPTNSTYSVGKYTPYIDNNNQQNGWKLLVTSRAFYLIEIFARIQPNAVIARVTFFGQAKSTLLNDEGKNIGYWCVGYQAPSVGGYPKDFLVSPPSFKIGNFENNIKFSCANLSMLSAPATLPRNLVAVELINPLYLAANAYFVGEQVGVLIKTCNDSSTIYGVNQTTFEGRPVLYICIGSNYMDTSSYQDKYVMPCMIYLDYWEF